MNSNGTLEAVERGQPVFETERQTVGTGRLVERQPVTEEFFVGFYNRGTLFKAALVDISNLGAGLRMERDDRAREPHLARGRTIECYLETPRGRTKCRGNIKWVEREHRHIRWGFAFIELPSDENDPLRMLIRDTEGESEYPLDHDSRYVDAD